MAERSRPPFRADHVGSLLRPEPLKQAQAAYAESVIDGAALRGAEDQAIRDAIRMQRDVGLRCVTDGELRRRSWHMDFIYSLGGVSQVEGESIHVHFRNEDREYDYAPPGMRVDAPITLERPIFADAFEFLRDNALEGQVPKLTIPSPSMVHYRGGNSAIDESVYPDLEHFWADLSWAYAQQIQAMHELGCRYVQLDDTSLAYVNDPAQRAHIEAIGGDPDSLHELYIEQINRALAGRPDDLTVTTHLCRGNNQSMWAAEGGYDFVAEALFGGLDVDGWFLEFDDQRSGGFEPLRFVPRDKVVVLGLVTTKRARLEDKEALKRRIDEAARYVDIDQLCLSPQCGFSSTVEGNDLTIDEQKAKLALVVEVAEEVWGR
ncbi:MAG TPA: 5-methyltetrahydropteroyltriglutamate--homocysteine S-methyltransferase [Solirubrobacteraceae bacterium]|jgi:5-methyltetrahydropteroyltriglutamate--homocysteine methyltransferase|nr:5-methyltetrahydropteroyltriglutamate--homocysteine S-methyltransferase [Solirubrobacteraceae bacterium]